MRTLLHFLRLKPVKAFVVGVLVPALDLLLTPVTLAAALLMKSLRRVGVWRLPLSRGIFDRVGVFPIRDHYYEPLFHPRHLRRPLHEERRLPGIDMNLAGQLELLARFDYASALDAIPRTGRLGTFFYDNPNFGAGDAEFLYCAIRHFRPAHILEIGSGFSTLMMLRAIEASRSAHPDYSCRLTCVEPYEMGFLDRTAGIELIRQPVELLDERRVTELGPDDILFIDSSHVLRPQGDVVREYLELLPLLSPGVLVHIHDIFTPRDYPAQWVKQEVRLYNEQYLVEAMLSGGARFRILAALNCLAHAHPGIMAEKFPVFRECRGRCEPSSLWLVRC
jgi:predicted O-methyltransferase YrrM